MEYPQQDKNFTDAEVAGEALRRAKKIRQKRANRKMWSAMTCGACAIAVALLVSYQVEAPAKLKAAPYIGTMYDGANIGGYVLIGLAMFVLGVAVTLLCTWHARHKR